MSLAGKWYYCGNKEEVCRIEEATIAGIVVLTLQNEGPSINPVKGTADGTVLRVPDWKVAGVYVARYGMIIWDNSTFWTRAEGVPVLKDPKK